MNKVTIYLFDCIWVLPSGSGATIRHNTQNNPPRSNKAQHTKLYILHTMNTITVQLQLQYKHSSQYSTNVNTINEPKIVEIIKEL
jgi:hypothetical protein